MQITKILKAVWLCAALIIAGLTTAQAQTTATWIGPASGGEWNTGANWNTGFPPLDSTTNALIGTGTNVSYNLPMTASGFGPLTNNGELNVNASGFNCTAITMITPSSTVNKILLITNSGAAVTVSGNLTMGTNSTATLAAGASLTVGGSLIVAASEGSSSGATSTFTNSGGTLNANATTINNNSGTGTGLMVISGGVNNLGNTGVGRYHGSSASTLGTEGLAIYGGVVTMTNLNAGNGNAASYLTAYIAGGTVTNFGNVFINNATAGRYSRVLQTGGLFVVPDPGVVNPNSTVAGSVTAIYSVAGGTNIVGGFSFGNSNTVAATTSFFTNGATIYVGSSGIATNGGTINTIFLNNGGLFGATAGWTGSAPMKLNTGSSGTFTFQTADMVGTPNNINLNSSCVLSGSGNLNITGGGTLLLGAANTYSGNTLVNGGTLALDVNGSLASTHIIVGSGTKFDVSAVVDGFVLTNQTLSGSGMVAGAVIVASGATIDPGSNTLTGTLSFSSSITETNGVINHFDLAGAPNPNNDLVIIAGDLDASGTNTVDIGGASLTTGANYPLIQYGGNFNGGLTNFALSQTSFGILSNNATLKTISFIPAASQRGATNIVWVGNPLNTNWDVEITTNWLNVGTGALDYFVPGDKVQFTDAGASNSPINIVGIVQPTSVLMNSHSNYVFLSTSGGWIAGTASLTVTNSGTLTILTTNTYSGITAIVGGSTLSVSNLANSLIPSAIGESGSLVISNGTFSYSGPSVGIDLGITLGTATSAINVSANGSLTLNGNLVGSGGLTTTGLGTLVLNGSSSYAGATTLGNGTLQVSTPAALGANTVNFDGGTLSLASASVQQFYPNVFNVDTTGTMIVNGANADNIIGTSGGTGSFSGTGILNIDIPNASGFCSINAQLESFPGIIRLTDDSLGTVRLNSGGSSSGAQECTGSTNATFDMGNGSASLVNRNGGGASFGTYDLGALTGAGTGTFVKGSATGSSPSTYSIGANNLSTTYSGTIADGGGTVAILKVGTGTLSLAGHSTYSGSTTVSNGVLALINNGNGDGSIDESATINVTSGTVLDVSARSDDKLQLGNNGSQLLEGRGTIHGGLYANGGGTVSPGGGLGGNTGTLTVSDDVTLAGTAWMKLNRGNTPNSDRIVSTLSSVSCYNTLVVTNIGVRLQAGDTFTLFSGAGGIGGGGFGNIILPNYYTWDTSQLNNNGIISVTAALPFPSITNVDYSGLSSGSIVLNADNGAPNGQVTVLTSTNLSLPLHSWTTVTSTTFDGNGNLSIPISVDSTVPQSFYLLQAN